MAGSVKPGLLRYRAGMRMPFEKLMEYVSALGDEDHLTMGELSARWGEPCERIMDAVDAVRVLRGERTYI